MIDFLKEATSLSEYTRALRRDFHRHPELGFQEVRTSGIVARELKELGLIVKTGIAKTGVVALLEGKHPRPVALLRFDMDALPIQEETGAEYASTTPGVMHACGHDGHTAIGLTVARLLQQHRNDLNGSVKLVFQPAEEGLGGAQTMLEEGLLENPEPDLALGLHLWNDEPIGWIGATPGPVMAAAEIFHLRIKGKGGHGALPHLVVDPVVAAAQVVTALQSIVSRNVSHLETAVISVTTIHAGEAVNVIPPAAELQGTIRTYLPEVRKKVLDRFSQVVRGVSEAMGCKVEIEVKSITPALVNDPRITAEVQETARKLLAGSHLDQAFSTMGSEDMAFILQKVPGCFFFVGSANPEKGLDAGHHHPCFDIDEESMPRAAALMAAAATRLLR